ncbi:MAG: hypothetical protein OXC62_11205 [Aestuariivita sp.]|nr:hypothetical protein [Aestuariivita sp.]
MRTDQYQLQTFECQSCGTPISPSDDDALDASITSAATQYPHERTGQLPEDPDGLAPVRSYVPRDTLYRHQTPGVLGNQRRYQGDGL